MERKEEPGHARRHGCYQKPLGPAIEASGGEHTKQDDQASKNSDKTDERVNYCVNGQYYCLPRMNGALSFDECEQIRVDLVLQGRWHTVRRALVNFQLRILRRLENSPFGSSLMLIA